MPDPDYFRDPVEILEHARKYLQNTRGPIKWQASQARIILGEAEAKAAHCIINLIGPIGYAQGMRCPCQFHAEESGQETVEQQANRAFSRALGSESHKHARDGKMSAAGDDQPEEE
jgi:hypothetical protein